MWPKRRSSTTTVSGSSSTSPSWTDPSWASNTSSPFSTGALTTHSRSSSVISSLVSPSPVSQSHRQATNFSSHAVSTISLFHPVLAFLTTRDGFPNHAPIAAAAADFIQSSSKQQTHYSPSYSCPKTSHHKNFGLVQIANCTILFPAPICTNASSPHLHNFSILWICSLNRRFGSC